MSISQNNLTLCPLEKRKERGRKCTEFCSSRSSCLLIPRSFIVRPIAATPFTTRIPCKIDPLVSLGVAGDQIQLLETRGLYTQRATSSADRLSSKMETAPWEERAGQPGELLSRITPRDACNWWTIYNWLCKTGLFNSITFTEIFLDLRRFDSILTLRYLFYDVSKANF